MDLDLIHAKIEAYFNQEMDEQERAEFEKAMQEDPQVKKELVIHALAEKSMEMMAEREVKQKLDAIRAKAKLKKAEPARIIPLWRRRPVKLAMAMSLIAVVMVTVLFVIPGLQGDGDQYNQEIQKLERGLVSQNNLSEGQDQPWQDCITLFDQKEYRQSIDCFSAYDQDNPPVLNFVAHSHFRLGEYAEAQAKFKQLSQGDSIETTADEKTEAEWNWFLTLAAQRDEQLPALLDSVMQDNSYKYFLEAMQLKELIENN